MIPVAEFFSVVIEIAEAWGQIIRDVHSSGVLDVQTKEVDRQPVTQADLRVQKTIESCLHKLYPSLEIQGEEDPSDYAHYESAIKADTHEFNKKIVSADLLNTKMKERKEFLT